MSTVDQDQKREHRIEMEIIVDAYTPAITGYGLVLLP